MKPKGHWIEKYMFEINDKQLMLDVLSNTTEILKVNVKPKSLWFIRHVFSRELQLEEGEILSDDDSEGEVINLFHKEIMSSECKEAKKPTILHENDTDCSYGGKYRHDSRGSYGWRPLNVTRSHQFQISKHHYSHSKSDWKIIHSDIRHRRPFNEIPRNPTNCNGYH